MRVPNKRRLRLRSMPRPSLLCRCRNRVKYSNYYPPATPNRGFFSLKTDRLDFLPSLTNHANCIHCLGAEGAEEEAMTPSGTDSRQPEPWNVAPWVATAGGVRRQIKKRSGGRIKNMQMGLQIGGNKKRGIPPSLASQV